KGSILKDIIEILQNEIVYALNTIFKLMIKSSNIETLIWFSSVYKSGRPNLRLFCSLKTLTIIFSGSIIQYSLTPACSYRLDFSFLSFLTVDGDSICTIRPWLPLQP